jgi:hypothetical protein
MAFEAKGFRHVAVAIPVFAIASIVVSALLAEYNAAYARNRARRKDGAAY